ncbi:MAG: TIGR00282 family metallophosphoesterase [Spirochaetia bacterium]
MSNTINALFLGDVLGQPGCRALFVNLNTIRKEHNIDLVIANGENAADGFGLTLEIAGQLIKAGVDVITSGNHIWHKREIFETSNEGLNILRPENYPPGNPGIGYCVVEVKGKKICVINLMGRKNLANLMCPFRTATEVLKKLKNKADIFLVDFHAEAPEEKESMAFYLDGRVSVLVGTHTHVQTMDERIFPQGTGYISDLGMTGPVKSVIGMEVDTAVQRVLSQIPLKMKVAEGRSCIQGLIAEIDTDTGKTCSLKRINTKLSV